MTYMAFLFMQGVLLGLAVAASSPSPYFAALGLVVASGMSCGLMAVCGGTFLSLILFLIYLGGMLVVFAYTSALASERYPEVLGSRWIALSLGVYVGMVVAGELCLVEEWESGFGGPGADELAWVHADVSGVMMLYSKGGGMLVISAWVLLLTLFVVLEVVRGLSRGSLRAV
uniref:NADH-ubiquinone oxidoreductase chain 6 n=1 Tax=Gobiidae sp. TaxID=3040165 RepID=A0AA96C6J8_9GOBI|nr:NADH dehydrogenase subunit 6 [Gobiidae sp.]